MSLNYQEAESLADLSKEVYKSNGGTPKGWTFITDSKAVLGQSTTGYYGALYQNNKTGEFAIAHRGTNELKDIGPDSQIVRDQLPSQFIEAYQFTDQVGKIENIEDISTIEQTGHSLGGALAKLVAMTTNAKAYTYNSPGVEQLRDNLGIRMQQFGIYKDFEGIDYKSKIIEVNTNGEPVSAFGLPTGTVYTIELPVSYMNNLSTYIDNVTPNNNSKANGSLLYMHSIENLYEALANPEYLQKKESVFNDYFNSRDVQPNLSTINNTLLDFRSEIAPGSNNTSKDEMAFLNGAGIHGGDWMALSPISVINGNGFQNEQMMKNVTDQWQPGDKTLTDNVLDSSINNFLNNYEIRLAA